MKCKEAHNEFLFLADGSITETRKVETEKHIAECAVCNALYKNVLETFNVIDEEKVTEINSFFFTGIEQKMKSKAKQEKVISMLRLKRVIEPLMLAAVIAMGLFFGILIGNNSSQQTEIANVEEEFAQEFYFGDNELAYQSIEEYLIEE